MTITFWWIAIILAVLINRLPSPNNYYNPHLKNRVRWCFQRCLSVPSGQGVTYSMTNFWHDILEVNCHVLKTQYNNKIITQKCVTKLDWPYISEQNACFPSISTLQLKNGKVVKMSELQIGDQVKTGNRKKTVK